MDFGQPRVTGKEPINVDPGRQEDQNLAGLENNGRTWQHQTGLLATISGGLQPHRVGDLQPAGEHASESRYLFSCFNTLYLECLQMFFLMRMERKNSSLDSHLRATLPSHCILFAPRH